MVDLPGAIPFIPLIAAGIGGAASLYGGYRQDKANQAVNAQAAQSTAAQQQLIGQLMAGISPDAYRAQAAQAGETALGQLSANFAQRGMLNSGALTTAGAQTLSRLYTDADARYQQDRMNAIGMALGGQQAIQRQYAGMVNPNPYEGLGAALGAAGTSAGQLLMARYGQGTATPATGGLGMVPGSSGAGLGHYLAAAPYAPTATPVPALSAQPTLAAFLSGPD